MYTLFASEDAGATYDPWAEAEDLETLQSLGASLDDNMLRWVIKDKDGNQVDVCRITNK